MHTTYLRIVTHLGVHQTWTFDAATKAASISAAMRFARRGWTLPPDDFADFHSIKKITPVDGLTYIDLDAEGMP